MFDDFQLLRYFIFNLLCLHAVNILHKLDWYSLQVGDDQQPVNHSQ